MLSLQNSTDSKGWKEDLEKGFQGGPRRRRKPVKRGTLGSKGRVSRRKLTLERLQWSIVRWVSTGWEDIINVLVKNNLIYIYNKFPLSPCNVPGHMVPDPMELMV